MYLETYRESGSFKHFGYEPERDREFGALHCGSGSEPVKSIGDKVTTTSDGSGHTNPPPEKP